MESEIGPAQQANGADAPDGLVRSCHRGARLILHRLATTRGDTPDGSANEMSGSATLRSVGMWSATVTALLAVVAFGVAATTPPRTGPFASPGTAVAYPYSAAARFVPRYFIGCISRSR